MEIHSIKYSLGSEVVYLSVGDSCNAPSGGKVSKIERYAEVRDSEFYIVWALPDGESISVVAQAIYCRDVVENYVYNKKENVSPV